MSKNSELFDLLNAYELILHPDLFKGLQTRLQAAYEENRKDAFEHAKISPEAQQIERLLLEWKERIERKTCPEAFALKMLYKDLLNTFRMGQKKPVL